MRELIYFLYQHPILLLVLAVWVFSGIASAAAKAKRAQQQPRRPTPEVDAWLERRRRERAQATGAERTAAGPSAKPTAEDIARQLREMLGLETAAPAPPPAPPVRATDLPRDVEVRAEVDFDERPHFAEADRGDDELVHGGQGKVGALHEAMQEKRAAPTAVTRSVAAHFGHGPTPTAVREAALRARAAFDSRAAVQAFVALEVLGPPRALRQFDVPHL